MKLYYSDDSDDVDTLMEVDVVEFENVNHTLLNLKDPKVMNAAQNLKASPLMMMHEMGLKKMFVVFLMTFIPFLALILNVQERMMENAVIKYKLDSQKAIVSKLVKPTR